jgi:hypothetical protein
MIHAVGVHSKRSNILIPNLQTDGNQELKSALRESA